MNETEFLQTVVTAEQGFFELCIRRGESWQQQWYDYPNQLHQIVTDANQLKTEGDVYFSSYLFSQKSSKKQHVLPSRTIQQDLDNADTLTLPLVPTVLVETSPNRHQAYWLLANETEQHEQLSRRLAYAIPLCDRSGWPLGHKVRFPNTFNYKYNTGPYPVYISQVTNRRYIPGDIELLPDAPTPDLDLEFLVNPPVALATGPHELIESIKDHLSAKVYSEYMSDSPSSDRSLSLFMLFTQCFKAGLSREQVYWIGLHSANNKFSQLRYHANRELAKDVLRAELATKSNALDIRELIKDLRKATKLLISERRRGIYDLVIAAMKQEGDFVRTVDNRRFYILRSQGRPIDVSAYAPDMAALLDIKYGLNKTETEHTYTLDSIISYMTTLPETAIVSALSHYDVPSNQVLIHTGRKQVISITPQSIEEVVDGTYGVVFPWDQEPFNPDTASSIDWGHVLFGNIPNCLNMSQEQVECILKVWLMFCILRNAASSRPILAFLGQPGSGKTTTARKIYAFLYGKHMDVSGVTNPGNFDVATANLPFFVLDNVDTWERWLPDRLAQSAGKTDVLVRELYSNNKMLRIKRQALVAVTAHDPKFGRADVADRMIIINLQRFSNLNLPFQDEHTLINDVIQNRNRLWGSLIKDLQLIIKNPIPTHTDLQLRIQDFAKLGEWISQGLNLKEQFRDTISTLQSSQREFNLDQDHALVTALTKWLQLAKCNPKPKTEDELYAELMFTMTDAEIRNFQQLFKSSTIMIKRISNLQDTLNTLMEVTFTVGKGGQRLWVFKCLPQDL